MKYLGTVKKENSALVIPDTFEAKDGQSYEAIEVGGDIILVPSPMDKERLEKIRGLAEESIRAHNASLKNLA